MKNEQPCTEARTVLLGKETGRFSQEEIASAESHVTSCEDCFHYFQYTAQFRELLKQKLGQAVTPPKLRESLLTQINTPQPPQFKRLIRFSYTWVGRAAVIAALVTAGSIGIYLGFLNRQDIASSLLPSLLVQDHIEVQLREHPFDLETSDQRELERWFAKRVDFAVSIPSLQGSKLQGGRLCYLLDRRVVFSVFEKDGKLISAYILDGSGIDLWSIEYAEHRKDHHFCRSEKGYNTVLWNNNGLIYGLVSKIPVSELEALAGNI